MSEVLGMKKNPMLRLPRKLLLIAKGAAVCNHKDYRRIAQGNADEQHACTRLRAHDEPRPGLPETESEEFSGKTDASADSKYGKTYT